MTCGLEFTHFHRKSSEIQVLFVLVRLLPTPPNIKVLDMWSANQSFSIKAHRIKE